MKNHSDDSADGKEPEIEKRTQDRKDAKGSLRPKLNDVGEEAKKVIKWLSFAKSNVSFGFQHLGPAYLPSMSEDRHAYGLFFDKVSGWNIPQSVLKSFGDGDYEVVVQLSLSFYQITTNTFFGSTWMSPEVSLGNSKRISTNILEFECNDLTYFYTRIIDPACVAVIEIVVSKIDSLKGTLNQFGCGWTMLEIFGRSPLDVADERDNIPLQSCSLFSGSPRDMLMNTDIKALARLLKEIPKCSLFYKLYGHRRMLKAQKLVGENEIIGRFDEVAGLISKDVVLPNSTRPQSIACFGDEERMDDGSVVHIYPSRPRLAMTMVFKIANCQLFIPKRDNLELKMIDAVHKLHPNAEKKDITILQRFLKIGLHNGHTIIGGHWLNQVLLEDKDDREILLTKEAVVNLHGYVPDQFMALAFVIEYNVGVTIPELSHYDSKSIVASVTKKPEVIVSQAILGTAIYIPYDGKQIRVSNKPKGKGSDDVDVEIKILKDETCAILSPSPLIQDEVPQSGPSTVAGSKTVNSKADEKGGDEKVKNRLSYVRESKSSLTIGKAAQTLPVLAEDENDAMLGFDLRIFHPIRGEIKNDEDVESLTKIEERELVKDRDEGKSDDEQAEESRKPKDEVQKFDRKIGPRISSTTERARRYDDDDSSSVVESIVSTGERGKSFLRIDRNYYGTEKLPLRKEAPDDATDRSSELSIPMRDRSMFGGESRSNLYAQALNAKLRAGPTSTAQGELLPSTARIEDARIAPKTVISLKGNEHYMREMTRGAKSRLNRYGIQDSVIDTPYHAVQTVINGNKPYTMKNRLPFGNVKKPVDVELEMFDEMSIHEINIQFAGFRPRFIDPQSMTHPEMTPMSANLPRAIYFSYQFYTCPPTRTESLRVLATNSFNELHVLVRDDRDVRDEPPLALRYIVDCSQTSPNEAVEFTDYLARKSLYVDVWDADGLMYIGTFGIPLRMLMRQGSPMVKQTIECDVINAEISAVSEGGVTLLVVTENGPVIGEVVGSVSVVLSNYGTEGKGPYRPRKGILPTSTPRVPIEGLNWRAHGIDERGLTSKQESRGTHRPRNIVRAKPLTDAAPDLSKALVDLRTLNRSDGHPANRSLASGRNFKGSSTLNYDEIMIIYRKFEGIQKGTVQYAGQLMVLMDLPSYPIAIKKFIKSFKAYADITFFKEELLRFANAAEEVKIVDLEEMLRIVFEKTGIKSRQEERILVAQRIADEYHDVSQQGYLKVKQIMDFISEETDRADWLIVCKRLRLCCQKAEMNGIDVEQMLAEYDVSGSQAIPLKSFRDFLLRLSDYGKLLPYDIALCCRYFSRIKRRSPQRYSRVEDPPLVNEDISCEEVMSTLGRKYIGNLQLRIQQFLKEENIELKYILRLFNHGTIKHEQDGGSAGGFYTFDQIESVFRSLQLFSNCITIDQFYIIVQKLDKRKLQKLSLTQILQYLGIPFKASDLALPSTSPRTSPRPGTGNEGGKKLSVEIPVDQTLDAEFLLNLLLQKVQENGIAVDQAFRHFDANGDGVLSGKELEEGLLQLAIFDSIPNWKSQLPYIVKKFDKNGDNMVSLKEFFHYLGIQGDYAPNIIQRLTKIFVIATEKNLSFKDIFVELDEDKNGTLDAKELHLGLQRLGTFNDVTYEDCEAIVKQFDRDGDKTVSIEEFAEYFHLRVQEATKVRKQRKIEMQRKILQQRFREVMLLAQQKGASIKQIFEHLDQDKGGSVSIDELFIKLKSLPNFKTVKNEEDILDLLKAMDIDGSGDISYEEFASFINGGNENLSMSTSTLSSPRGGLSQAQQQRTIYEQIREVYGAALAKGISFEKLFSLVDKDRSGALSLSELDKILRMIPSFKNITQGEVRTLFDMIDTDHSGLISTEEFKRFVVEGRKDYQEDKRFAHKVENQQPAVTSVGPTPYELQQEEEERRRKKQQEDYSNSTEGLKEKFLRHFKKTAEYNGGIRNIFANLDYDGDGIITYLSLIKFFRTEDFYDLFNEEQIDIILKSFFTNKHRQSLYVIPLIQWLTGEKGEPKKIMIASEQDEEFDAKFASDKTLPEYVFSTNPEAKAVERKLRQFGQILAKKGVDVESKFQYYDPQKTGCIPRTDFIKVLSDLGIYLLEEGKVLKENQLNSLGLGSAVSGNGYVSEDVIRQLQRRQIYDLKGSEGGSSFVSNAPKLARKVFYSDYPSHLLENGKNMSEFKNHLESLTLIDWYRQGQKQMLLQHVLSHSLAHTIRLYPRFGKTLFFEYPIHNPFNHEERFDIEINDSELRLVTNIDEWNHLRKTVKPCVGELGSDPMEVELFDYDQETRNISVTLLPNEILYLPFTFMTLIPYVPLQRKSFQRKSSKLLKDRDRGRSSSYEDRRYPESKEGHDDEFKYDKDDADIAEEELIEDVQRIIDVKIISGSHGHLVAILRAHIHPRPFITHRVLRFHEYENSIAKRKIRLVGIDESEFNVLYPGRYMTEMKYIHCVENTIDPKSSGAMTLEEGSNSRVVIEWGSRLQESSFAAQDDHIHSLDMLIRYRCLETSSSGMFYILVYNDPYQSELHEIWQVIIYSRLRLDIHGMVGTPTAADLVIRGDRYPRRVRAFASSLSTSQLINFKPESAFQLVPGAYNRVMATIIPKQLGNKRALINVVDCDTKELLSVWLASIHATAPAVMRSYDVEVGVNKPIYKKILFKNLWDAKRKFTLTSSDETLMRPRVSTVEIGPQGTEYLRLWFNGWNSNNATYESRGVMKEVYLFLNDAVTGQSEECNLFRIRLAI